MQCESRKRSNFGGSGDGDQCIFILMNCLIFQGNYRLMKLLLSRGADCREKDNEGQTPLHLCTRHKLPKCMAMLLRQLLPGEIDNQDNNKVQWDEPESYV